MRLTPKYMRCIQRIYPGESNCENVNDKCNHPVFRWNVIATRACCLSGRHLSIVGDDEAAFIEVRRAKTISRPDLFCTAGIPADERWQSLQVRHDLNSLSIGQPTNHHTIPCIQSNVPARSLNLPQRSHHANGGPGALGANLMLAV